METFFILLILVFLPFLWFINRALRYTDETIGEHSPLYVERTYHISATDYFSKFLKIMILFLLFIMVALTIMLVKIGLRQEPFGFVFALIFLAFAGYLVFFFYVDWQYWTITRNVAITLNPFAPSITVNGPTQYALLTPDNVLHIEHHLRKTENSKDILGGYGYFLFYDVTGQITEVNNIFLIHVEFLERFFSAVPPAVVWHSLPWPVKTGHI